jgi:DNA-binding IclR family transcriptional regulator
VIHFNRHTFEEGVERGQAGAEIARQSGLSPEEVSGALETLLRHDVMMEVDGRWRFSVELMRRCVARRAAA